jgi:omega-6 fatty acid desaturase (delta-12 desaturase)
VTRAPESTNRLTPPPSQKLWRSAVAKYERPDLKRSIWQIANSVIPYLLLWWAMYESLSWSWWITAALAFPAAGFLVRIFIIFHDCTHGSFFRSHRYNSLVGFFTGVLTFTPFRGWQRSHSIHHATSGDLDRRGIGDVWTMTVREYTEASPWLRFRYRVFRNPLVLFVIGPPVLFLFWHRFSGKSASRRERLSVLWTNLSLLGLFVLMETTVGWADYLIVQGAIMAIAGPAAVWLFYVQHQFEETYWEHHEDWEYIPACLQGSSYYKLPRVLQWFTGNIGFHHIHHLSPRVPNYFLERCHREHEQLMVGEPLTIRSSLRSLRFRLWCEERGRMIRFDELDRGAAA